MKAALAEAEETGPKILNSEVLVLETRNFQMLSVGLDSADSEELAEPESTADPPVAVLDGTKPWNLRL